MKNRLFPRLIIPGLVLFLISVACSFLSKATPSPTVREEQTNQHLLETIDALTTLVAEGTHVVEVTRIVPATIAASPSPQPQETATPNIPPALTATSPARATPLPTTRPVTALTPLSPQPGITATDSPASPSPITPLATAITPAPTYELPPGNEFCNKASFISDVSIPDGTTLAPGQTFTKTWRIQNVSPCPWSTDYGILFVDGTSMGNQGVRFTSPIAPGQMADVSVPMVAPSAPGTYQSFWVLTDGYNIFGTGPDSKTPLWLRVNIKSTPGATPDPKVVVNLVDTYCSADWESGAGILPCPGTQRSKAGFVQKLNSPSLETRKEDEAALWTNPEMTKDGFISGTYPPLKIEPGYRFMADIGCLSGRPYCDVLFRLNYLLEDKKAYNLGEWHEKADQEITRVDVDLTPLAGQTVQLQLIVLTNGPYSQDGVFWLQPQVRRK